MIWAGHVARMGGKRNAYRILVLKADEKRPLWIHRRRWEDNIGMNLKIVYLRTWSRLIWLVMGTVAW